MARALAAVVLVWAGTAAAQGWYEPERGSADRRGIMNAMRPQAEVIFGPPVEFVVGGLRVAGDVAFAMVSAQRPGGTAIDIAATPGWQSGYFLPDADWTGGQAFFRRTATGWVATEVVFGATDVWWAEPMYCAQFRPVIAEVCP
ncbi:hypothetical protein [Defluviimonas sp. SAOS-178_SWC]|uniref:hypothetical protein n=1 Tax=Defluviimonas sp. SAOS-178_SWC TaxID=3121287 RepID=UPI003222134B